MKAGSRVFTYCRCSHNGNVSILVFDGYCSLSSNERIEQAVAAAADHNGPVYMRLLRGKEPLVLDEYNCHFELRKAKLLQDRRDVLLISSGIMTMRVLETAKALVQNNIDDAVLFCMYRPSNLLIRRKFWSSTVVMDFWW